MCVGRAHGWDFPLHTHIHTHSHFSSFASRNNTTPKQCQGTIIGLLAKSANLFSLPICVSDRGVLQHGDVMPREASCLQMLLRASARPECFCGHCEAVGERAARRGAGPEDRPCLASCAQLPPIFLRWLTLISARSRERVHRIV